MVGESQWHQVRYDERASRHESALFSSSLLLFTSHFFIVAGVIWQHIWRPEPVMLFFALPNWN